MGDPTYLATLGCYNLDSDPRKVPDYVSGALLSADTAKEFTIPAGAKIVRIAGSDDLFYKFDDDAAVPADTDDGTACELVKDEGGPEWLIIPPNAETLSVISAGTPLVTLSFYKQ